MRDLSRIGIPTIEALMQIGEEVPERDESAKAELLAAAPWAFREGALSLVCADTTQEIQQLMYYIIAAVGTDRPIRCVLSRCSEKEFLTGLMRAHSGLSLLSAGRLWGDEKRRDEFRARYDQTCEWVRSLDLKIGGWTCSEIEDMFGPHGPMNDYTDDSIILFDSLVAMTSRVSDDWELSRDVIGAKLRDWLHYSSCSVLIFDRWAGSQTRRAYEILRDYLDGTISVSDKTGTRKPGQTYYKKKIHLSHERTGFISTTMLYYDGEAGRLIDAPPEPAPDQPDPDHDLLF